MKRAALTLLAANMVLLLAVPVITNASGQGKAPISAGERAFQK
jgi:hypothetical protein